jgi:hypothetical protein
MVKTSFKVSSCKNRIRSFDRPNHGIKTKATVLTEQVPYKRAVLSFNSAPRNELHFLEGFHERLEPFVCSPSVQNLGTVSVSRTDFLLSRARYHQLLLDFLVGLGKEDVPFP